METILGGRFVVQHTRGQFEMEGEVMSFEGMGIFGYDNLKKKHIFVWLDNMGTMIMTAEGTADPTGKIITYFSEMPNPMTGETMPIKSVSTIVDDDKQIFEMYAQVGGTEWSRNMEIISTRTR